jgi:hypothetical protein
LWDSTAWYNFVPAGPGLFDIDIRDIYIYIWGWPVQQPEQPKITYDMIDYSSWLILTWLYCPCALAGQDFEAAHVERWPVSPLLGFAVMRFPLVQQDRGLENVHYPIKDEHYITINDNFHYYILALLFLG